MSLADLLAETRAASATRMPPEAIATITKINQQLEAEGIGQSALTAGDMLPNATLTNQNGEAVEIHALLSDGPLVLNFYRGGWCPYCNFELKAYQDLLPQFQAKGAQLVGVTPEKPDNSLSTREKNALSFPILTDAQNGFAKALGIAFNMPDDLVKLYSGFGLDLPNFNEGTGWALPIPATFVADGSGKILLADVDQDYTRRLEPTDALAALG
jgi:peroxiredoxin